MKIYVAERDIQITDGNNREKFACDYETISNVKIMAGRAYEPPKFLRKFIKPPIPQITAILLFSNKDSISIVSRDQGFSNLLEALSLKGWNIEGAKLNAMKHPYVRQDVGRKK